MKTILVIEDETSLRGSICDLLELEGFQVLAAENGATGLTLAHTHLPDLILCDVQMPDMNGYEVLSRLQRSGETTHIPFIFLTAHGTKADMRHGMELGADDYLTKPCTSDELLRAIATRLGKVTAQQTQTQQKLDALRSSIALSLPHELRTPLTNILGSVELLSIIADCGDAEKIREIGAGIHQSASRLEHLIQNYLLYAQIEIMTRDPERLKRIEAEVCSHCKSVILEVAQALRAKAGATDLELTLEDAPLKIAETSFCKVVEELLSNAFKFSSGSLPVRVTGKVLSGAMLPNTPLYYQLEITNYGRGFTAQQIAQIGAYMQFDRRFYEQQGVGLGLAIARRLVELHGGKLEIESIPQQHTTLRVLLPLAGGRC